MTTWYYAHLVTMSVSGGRKTNLLLLFMLTFCFCNHVYFACQILHLETHRPELYEKYVFFTSNADLCKPALGRDSPCTRINLL